jgi:hypothetical protein
MSKIRTQRDRELMGVAQIVSMCPESSRDALQVLNYARNIIREFVCDHKERPRVRLVTSARGHKNTTARASKRCSAALIERELRH